MTPQQIRELRQGLKLTQQQLADKIGARQHTVARWETGMNEPKRAYAILLRQLSETAKKRRSRKNTKFKEGSLNEAKFRLCSKKHGGTMSPVMGGFILFALPPAGRY